jgi:dTDP-glucose 4,6-dehydratase
VYGDGSQTRSLCYVDDLIRGLYLLAMSGEHLPVNIGNPDHELTMLELAQTVHPRHGLDERDRLRGAAGRRPAGAPPRHHARPQILGWEPEIASTRASAAG